MLEIRLELQIKQLPSQESLLSAIKGVGGGRNGGGGGTSGALLFFFMLLAPLFRPVFTFLFVLLAIRAQS